LSSNSHLNWSAHCNLFILSNVSLHDRSFLIFRSGETLSRSDFVPVFSSSAAVGALAAHSIQVVVPPPPKKRSEAYEHVGTHNQASYKKTLAENAAAAAESAGKAAAAAAVVATDARNQRRRSQVNAQAALLTGAPSKDTSRAGSNAGSRSQSPERRVRRLHHTAPAILSLLVAIISNLELIGFPHI
jgi:hypothetical protein